MKNQNKKVYMTKKRKVKIAMHKTFLLLAAIMLASGIIGNAGQRTLEGIEMAQAQVEVPKHQPAAEIKEIEAISETIREITAYNAGDPAQTDSTPCDGAGGNICEKLEAGIKVCAANFVPLGTRLYVENYGECTVLDRMNRKYRNRVDIAMKKSEKERAVKFGIQLLHVKILK